MHQRIRTNRLLIFLIFCAHQYNTHTRTTRLASSDLSLYHPRYKTLKLQKVLYIVVYSGYGISI